jgi:hypothetical protein
MAHKQRPFTRRQRAHILKKKKQELAAERRSVRTEAKAYAQTIELFKHCDPARTEALGEQ